MTLSAAARFVSQGRKIVAIGWNYRLHAQELQSALPTQPLFFLKPTSSYVQEPDPILIPTGVGAIHHEVELGVVIGRGGRDIATAAAEDHIAGYTLGIDVTARQLQNEARESGGPWSESKGYDTFTPVSSFIPKSEVADHRLLSMWLKVNGTLRQQTSCAEMVFDPPTLINHVSRVMRLDEGDMILTGTPDGIGPIEEGDLVEAGLTCDGKVLRTITFPVKARVYPPGV